MTTINRDDYETVTKFDEMIGRTCAEVTGKEGEEEMRFAMRDGSVFVFWHQSDCCENVSIAEVVGDLDDLVGAPLVEAEEVDSSSGVPTGDSYTWTFYKFTTAKGTVTVRWLGTSNGYYSESVAYREELKPRVPDVTNILYRFEVQDPKDAVDQLGAALAELEKDVH